MSLHSILLQRTGLAALVALLGLAISLPVSADLPQPVLVKDIQPGSAVAGSVAANQLTAAGNRAFFVSNNGIHGDELWISDGLTKGTRMVKDIRPGTASSEITRLTAAGAKVFFSADDGTHDRELWVSDGTEKGTFLVADLINTPGIGGNPAAIQPFAKGVVFVANSDFHRMALWYTDGTAGGTRLLKELTTAEVADPAALTRSWGVLGTQFYFSFQDSETTSALWKTDGTLAGTVLVKTFTGPTGHKPRVLGAAGKLLYLNAWTESAGWELWKTDGTTAGTVQLKDINIGTLDSSPSRFAAIGSKGYFTATTADAGTEMWVTDGTEAGTRMIVDAITGSGSPGFLQLAALGNRILATSAGSPGQVGLRAYDPVKNTTDWLLLLGPQDLPRTLVVSGAKAWLVATRSQNTGIWVSNGTVKGTSLADNTLKDSLSPQVSTGSGLAFTPSLVYFNAFSKELWTTNGAATRKVSGIGKIGAGSRPANFLSTSTALYFTASTIAQGEELWKTDGTAAGTVMVKDINPGPDGSAPSSLVEMNGVVYFAATTRDKGRELWRTDGSPDGTVLLKDISPGTYPDLLGQTSPYSSDPRGLTVYNGRIYFSVILPGLVYRTWVTDGTTPGTTLFADTFSGTTQSGMHPGEFAVKNGALYFVGGLNASSMALFRTYGQPGDVTQVSSPFYSISGLKGGQNTILHFRASAYSYSAGLFYVYDDSNNQVTPLTSGYPADFSGQPLKVQFTGPIRVFFGQFIQGNYLGERIFSQGTGQPVSLAQGVNVKLLGISGNRVLFTESSITLYGAGAVKSINIDGTGLTTLIPTDSLQELTQPVRVEGDIVYFSRTTASGENLLWRSQGTPETTEQVPGVMNTNSDRFEIIQRGEQLFISADGARTGTGQELFKMDRPAPLQLAQAKGYGGRLFPLTGAAVFDAGPWLVQSDSTEHGLHLTNTGPETLYGTILVAPVGGAFTIQPFFFPMIAPGESAYANIRFNPKVVGKVQESVQISYVSGLTNPSIYRRTLTLTGTGISATKARPIVGTAPVDQLVMEGESFTMGPPMYIAPDDNTFMNWKRGSALVSDGPDISISEITTTDAGQYTFTVSNRFGSAKSTPVTVAVLSVGPESVTGNEGGVITLEARVTAPKGTNLTYLWHRGPGTPLQDVDRIRGSRTPKLQISNLQLSDQAFYECIVTLHNPGGEIRRSPAVTALTVKKRPVFVPIEETPFSFVGESLTYEVQAIDALSFTAKGLPPGLKMDTDGLVTGTPTKAGVYAVTLTAINAAGSTVQIRPWEVRATVPAGSYEALLSRIPAVGAGQPGLGSQVKVTVSAVGAFSGQVLYEGRLYRFAGVPELTSTFMENDQTLAVSEIKVSRGKSLPALTLSLRAGGNGTASVYDPAISATVAGLLRKSAFSAAMPATAFVGRYNLVLDSDDYGPRGCGFLSATVSKTGGITWKGKLADGTTLTGSSVLAESSAGSFVVMHLHHDLYMATGSVHGAVDLYDPEYAPEGSMAHGLFTWNKAAILSDTSQERVFKDGILYHDVEVIGTRYAAPGKNEYIMQLPGGALNAGITVQSTDIAAPEGRLTQRFTTSQTHKVTLPPAAPGAFLEALFLDAALGTFRGTVVIPNETPGLVRRASFEGVLDPRSTGRSAGFFLMPELPPLDFPVSAIRTTPMTSALIEITP